MTKTGLVLSVFGCLFGTAVLAQEPKPDYIPWWDCVKNTWHSNQWELVVPVNTWHNRFIYEKDKIKEYNERPWGIGIGKSYLDENKNRHSLVALTFQDSHDDPEPTFGYSKQWIWRDTSDAWRFTLGYIAGITFRSDYDYVPIPAVLPVIGFEYKRFSLENTYIPGLGDNNGNVLFTWVRWRF